MGEGIGQLGAMPLAGAALRSSKYSGQVVTKEKETDDVYSFGMILWELFTENEPLPGQSRKRLHEIIGLEGFCP